MRFDTPVGFRFSFIWLLNRGKSALCWRDPLKGLAVAGIGVTLATDLSASYSWQDKAILIAVDVAAPILGDLFFGPLGGLAVSLAVSFIVDPMLERRFSQ